MDDFLGRDGRDAKSTQWTSHQVRRTTERAQREHQAMPGICRICRGEGDEHEPLFHPCRCSGSIQHVHQNCLMDWLAHSQKKYCELCKTPYRFTKYYDPKMPDQLPVLVFIDRVSRYALENSLHWLRGFIACSFWLIALPYVMRRGWATMFWLSQENWTGTVPDTSFGTDPSGGVVHLSSTLMGLDMCPASPFYAPTTTPAGDIAKMMGWGGSQTLSGFWLRCWCRITGLPLPVELMSAHVLNPSVPRPVRAHTHITESFLSDVSFLRNLTRNPQLNQGLINILEGQILTIVAMVSFILVILVRDYVVQQQPELLNIRAGLLDGEQLAQPRVAVEPAQLPHQDGNDSDAFDNEDAELQDMQPNEDDPAQEDQGARVAAAEGHGVLRVVNEFAAIDVPDVPRWAEDEGSNQRSSDGPSSDAAATPDDSQSGSNADTDCLEGPHEDNSDSSLRWRTDHRPLPGHDDPSVEAGPSRPRSVSDGPQIQSNINPLANNTWSFDVGPSGSQNLRVQQVGSSDDDEVFQVPSNADDNVLPQTAGDRGGIDESAPWQRATHDSVELGRDPLTPSSSHPTEPDTTAALAASNKPVRDRVADFLWADVDNIDHEAVAAAVDPEDDSDDAQWRDMPEEGDAGAAEGDNGNHIDEPGAGLHVDDGAGNRAADADVGLDPEAIEDMEDFEGVMELLGMRGPITNLFQNVIFCAILVQAALFGFVFIPFNLGRITIWMLAKPVRMLRILYGVSIVLQDICFFAGGFMAWIVFNLVDMFTMTRVLGESVAANVVGGRKITYTFFVNAGSRIWGHGQEAFFDLAATEHGMRYWSAISHEALSSIRNNVVSCIVYLRDVVYAAFSGHIPLKLLLAGFRPSRLQSFAVGCRAYLTTWKDQIANIPIIPRYETKLLDLGHATWPTADITWAILAGYLTLFGVAALYHKFSTRRGRATAMGDIEATIIDIINQASGILKVITIISIEMLVFPLYCGMLLACALLPLFKETSITSRWLFTYQSPWTSLFIHWFVGTGYMFHFALFVSMCRKIMRPGVLYFIRDPDDPEFHPVRDVLERNLMNQLRKIMFSAFVYGGLVIVCLGGVVWGLTAAAPGILPIHYSSNEPVLEFPVDLLFYNFFMPLAFRLLKPGTGLQLMYKWCFRKSARMLRLSNFIFGERRIDEEGVLQIVTDSKQRNASALRRPFLGLNAKQTKVVPLGFKEIVDGVQMNPRKLSVRDVRLLRQAKSSLIKSGQLVPDGKFVKAPASDRVKITKPTQVFLPVDDKGRREDGSRVEGIHATKDFKTVYIPPWFRTRIFLFTISIWTFAAVTGVSLTIAPLVVGRMIFKMVLPSFVRTNDIYAFCIGIHVLGLLAYGLFHAKSLMHSLHRWAIKKGSVRPYKNPAELVRLAIRLAGLLYTYTLILVVCPLVMATLIELYINIPLHTFLNPPSSTALRSGKDSSQHNVRIVEAWTLGLLYMRLAIKVINSFVRNTRFARALRAVLRRGWLDPDIRILTKGFVIPGLVVASLAILVPGAIVSLVEGYDGFTADSQDPYQAAAERVMRYRAAYPLTAFIFMALRWSLQMSGKIDTLKAQVRDDAYLMGEQLQNYDSVLGLNVSEDSEPLSRPAGVD